MAFEDVEERRTSGLDHEWCLVQNSDPRTDIYGELQNTAEKFKMLADRLQRTASKKLSLQDVTNEQAVQTDGCCEETKTKLMNCIAENLRLRQSLKDVSDINHRWQEYNHDRQKHVQHLMSTVSELRRTIDAMKQQYTKSSPLQLRGSELNDQTALAVSRTTDAVKRQLSTSSTTPPKESGGSESDATNRVQSPPELARTVDTTCQKRLKSTVSMSDEKNVPKNEMVLLNDKLSHEIRVLSKQLKETRNESEALKQQFEKAIEENVSLRTLLKMYKSEWEDENREKVEALSQAQKVVQELCALKINCQMQAERLMKMCTVTFNCSLCNGQSRQALNNLNIDNHLEHNARSESRGRHKKKERATATAVIQSIDGTEVHLQERCGSDKVDKTTANCSSPKMSSMKKLSGSVHPIITFPDSDSEQSITVEKQCVQHSTSQHFMCPVCSASFLQKQESQFLDHYTKCKLSPYKKISTS